MTPLTSFARPLAAALLMLVTAGVASSVAHAQDKYAVTLDRRWTKGQSYVIDTWITTREHLLAVAKGEDDKTRNDTDRIHMVAEATVTASDPASRSMTVRYKVRQCIRYYSEIDSSEHLPEGTEAIFTMKKGKATMVSADGEHEEYEFYKIRDAIVESMLGTQGVAASSPKSQGESWQLSKAEVVRAIGGWSDLVLSEKNVSAKATLLGVSPADEVPTMRVLLSTDLNGFTFTKMGKLKVEKANGTIELMGDLPIDPAKGPLATKLVARFLIKAKGKPAPSAPFITAEIGYEREVVTTFIYQ